MGAPSLASFEGWDEITGKIKAIIANSPFIGNDGQGNQQVFDYAPANFNAYPAVVIDPDGETGAIADQQRNKYTFTWKILVMSTRMNLDPDLNTSYSLAESNMRKLVDDLMVRLNADITVGGLGSAFSRPVEVKWGYIKGQDIDTRSCTITIQVVVGQ